MSYETDVMMGLSSSLRNTDGLRCEIKKLNTYMPLIEALTKELERANDLKLVELGLSTTEDYYNKHIKNKVNGKGRR